MKRFSCMGFKICLRLIVPFRKGWQWHLFCCYSSTGRMCASKIFVRRVTWGPFVWRLLCIERERGGRGGVCKSLICFTADAGCWFNSSDLISRPFSTSTVWIEMNDYIGDTFNLTYLTKVHSVLAYFKAVLKKFPSTFLKFHWIMFSFSSHPKLA